MNDIETLNRVAKEYKNNELLHILKEIRSFNENYINENLDQLNDKLDIIIKYLKKGLKNE